MSKKSTPTQKAARMLDLVPYISSHQGISTGELAEQFGISVAELLSDLNSLWMCGDNRFDLIDLEFESGYVSIRNAQTLNRVRNLSHQEIIAIVLGLDLISKDLPEERIDLQEDIKTLRTKLGKGIERVIDATPSSNGEALALIKQSLTTGRKLQIEYLAALDGSLTSRVVSPIDFYVSDNRDFLVAFCELADAQRTFRIDRIKDATLLDLVANPTSSSASPDITIKATVEIVTEKRRSRESLGKFVAGAGPEVEVSTYSLSWLARTVIASGGAMKVLAPSATRSEVASLAAKALAIYR
jgi:proteasome accessory factor C